MVATTTRDAPTKRFAAAGHSILPVVPFVSGWLVTILVFYPGHMNGDTVAPYFQAKGVWPWSNWHGTINILIWELLLRTWDNPACVLVLQTTLIWGSFAVMALHVRRQTGTSWSWHWVVALFLPVTFNYLGALIKDTMSVALLLTAIALLVVERSPPLGWARAAPPERGEPTCGHGEPLERAAPRRRGSLLAGAAVLLALSALVKPATLGSTAIMLAYVVDRGLLLARPSASGRMRIVGGAASLVVASLALLAAPGVLDRVTGARDDKIERALMLFDLTGMSSYLGQDEMPAGVVPTDRTDEFLSTCYNSHGWDDLAFGECSWVEARVLSTGLIDTDAISTRWKDAIAGHPLVYLRHRAHHLWTFLTDAGNAPFYYDYRDPRVDWSPGTNPVMDAYDDVIERTERSLLFRPVIWLVVSASLLWFELRRPTARRSRWHVLLVAMLASNLVFYAGLAVIGVASEYRYSYTVIMSLAVVTCVLVAEAQARRSAADTVSLEGRNDRIG